MLHDIVSTAVNAAENVRFLPTNGLTAALATNAPLNLPIKYLPLPLNDVCEVMFEVTVCLKPASSLDIVSAAFILTKLFWIPVIDPVSVTVDVICALTVTATLLVQTLLRLGS